MCQEQVGKNSGMSEHFLPLNTAKQLNNFILWSMNQRLLIVMMPASRYSIIKYLTVKGGVPHRAVDT